MQPRTIRILLIDDDPEQAAFLSDFLAEPKEGIARFELESTDRLSSGLERLRRDAYDVVLLDLGLPDSQGIATFSKVAAQAARIPVIPMTGLGDERLSLEAMSLGAQDYLVKGSFNSAVLRRAILYAVERKRLLGQMEDLIAKNADGMVVVDSRGCVRYVNRAAEAILGQPSERMTGRLFDFPVFPNQVTELKFPTPKGREKIAEMRTTEIEWQGQSACLASIRDITELRDLERLKAEVKERRRLDELKDEFLAGVSSELRAPLTVLHGAVCSLLRGVHGALNDAQAKTAQLARKSSERLIRTINNLLDISRLESGRAEPRLEPVEAAALLRAAAQAASRRAQERGVAIELRAPPDLPSMDADPKMIAQALDHLLDNALRHAKSKVLLCAKSVEGAPPAGCDAVKLGSGLGITLVRARRWLQISVIDDGPGIPKAGLGLLFGKFVQVQPAGRNGVQGAGLGLAICKAIVENHRGRIWAESGDGSSDQGTLFHFIIPRREKGGAPKAQGAQARLPAAKSPAKK